MVPARARSDTAVSPLLPGRTPWLELVVADSSAAAAALRDSLGATWAVAPLGYLNVIRTRRAPHP